MGHGRALDKGNRRFYSCRQRRLLRRVRRVFWGWAHEVNLSSHNGQHQPALHPLQQEPLQTFAQGLHPQNNMNGPACSMGWDACHEVTTGMRGHAHKLKRYNKEVLDWNAEWHSEIAQVPQVAVCCSVLQCVAVCCSVFQCVAVCYSVLQCVAVCCSVL